MTRGIRLALVRQRHSSHGGGERVIERIVPVLESAGIDVSLITRAAEGWGARNVLTVNPFHVGRLSRDRGFADAARTAWKQAGFDLVQSHERIPGCDIYRAGDGLHRVWLRVRGESGGRVRRIADRLSGYHRYVCAAEREMLEHPRLRAVICNSRMVRDEILQTYRVAPERLHVIHNGVDLDAFSPSNRGHWREAVRGELGCRPRDTVFLFVGSGFARKGLDAAIAALAHAASQAFRLWVVGEDRARASFEARAREAGLGERVRFLGARDDVRPYYAAADVFLLPTRYDPFPNAALEALATGLPAVVGRRSGAAEIVRDGENGWLCDPADPQQLSRILHAADVALRDERMSAAARASAEAHGLEAMAARLVALYGALVQSR